MDVCDAVVARLFMALQNAVWSWLSCWPAVVDGLCGVAGAGLAAAARWLCRAQKAALSASCWDRRRALAETPRDGSSSERAGCLKIDAMVAS